MAIPEAINQKLIKELEVMGFPLARAARALHSSGNNNIEAAIDWIIHHEKDPDIDEMPRVSIELDVRSPEPLFITEEMITKAQQLRDCARKSTLEEKNSRREREKERIREGKELLEAKRTAEENERKRFLASRKADKDEEKRARERILQKLENDKLEMRHRFGLGMSPINPKTSRHTLPLAEENKSNMAAYSVAKAEKMRECLRSIKHKHKADQARVTRALETLLIYIGNVARNPDVEKFRRIRISNPAFQERVGALEGGMEFLQLCGFEMTEGTDFLYLPRDKMDMAVLHSAGIQLKSAVTNPYFGLLSHE
ncbi:hypothetical protein SAY86_014854 [Trapa natans]|uniref:UBA domain-containing protein n=1 Tax=Trapa natans TaxID=22666 RepID=A0AAN7QGN7_TRANT|nr:hypothetical protein SAY86_014854 [Trapa natans]